jgi:hypothetical protein
MDVEQAFTAKGTAPRGDARWRGDDRPSSEETSCDQERVPGHQSLIAATISSGASSWM